jgi:hypothetical protein
MLQCYLTIRIACLPACLPACHVYNQCWTLYIHRHCLRQLQAGRTEVQCLQGQEIFVSFETSGQALGPMQLPIELFLWS